MIEVRPRIASAVDAVGRSHPVDDGSIGTAVQ
jgi:hypothetical protein